MLYHKKRIGIALSTALLSSLFVTSSHAETGHYVNGAEGLKAATVPTEGFYYRSYNIFYNANRLTNKDGDELPVNFDVSVYAMANRFIWMTKHKFLGADVGMDIVVPLVRTHIKIGAAGIDEDEFNVGDINIEPLILSWHKKRYDAVVAASFYAPTGNYSAKDPASPGKGFWTGMLTFGGTYYLNPSKTWSASILSRYEFHGEQDETDMTAGDDFHFEWGIGKSIGTWEVGAVGYQQWQVTEDSGKGATDVKDRVSAAGLEVNKFIPSIKTVVSLRALKEFGAKDRSEGSTVTLTLTKIF